MQPSVAAAVPERARNRQFAFDGGAGTYFGTGLLAFLITVFTLGICDPFAFVLLERWRARHPNIEGRQLVSTAARGAVRLVAEVDPDDCITLGIYSFWVMPRIYRWKWEHTSWAR
jgi:uncharacterized membrane protein YjgN (DUF898 family)